MKRNLNLFIYFFKRKIEPHTLGIVEKPILMSEWDFLNIIYSFIIYNLDPMVLKEILKISKIIWN